ncbi:glycosyltransferase family 2 protein [Daejeonia sp. YH14]|uniref:glycosyltransferase family 2 protein n=1 Tax=Daejeonia sp. YH14 TaxID=3439042 RepID=UPI003F4912B6
MECLKILVILVTYNSEKWIRKNLNSILDHGGALLVDIFVVDNGSSDQTTTIIEEEYPEVILKKSTENLGFGKANNIAFDYALEHQYDFVFLVNHDGWLRPGFWKNVSSVLSNPEYDPFGLLSPVHYDCTERDYDFGFKKYAAEALNQNSEKEVVNVDMINGAFLFISKKCLTDVKGFDPIFFFYGEDIDLCLRAKKKGYKIGVIKTSSVVHDRIVKRIDDKRISFHLFANTIIQIKSKATEGFFINFCKGLFSNISKMTTKTDVGYKPELYIMNIIKLIKNYKKIKISYKKYNSSI